MIKKWVLVLLIGFIISNAYAEMESPLTGKATTNLLNISIVVVAGPPALNIIYPHNVTYMTNVSILFRFLNSSTRNVWYGIDSSNNVTLGNNLYYINVSEGGHTLYLYADNNDGINSTRNVSFAVNLTRLKIYYEKFKNNGVSTDFIQYGIEELENLTNLTFENSAYGKIAFYEGINITNINSSDKSVIDFDSDSNIAISSNRLFINTSIFSNLNSAALITLRGLTYSNPRILLNGQVCVAPQCNRISYSVGNIVFNSSQTGLFSLEETPVTPAEGGSGGGGGGGGGGGAAPTDIENEILLDGFRLNMTSFTLTVLPGESRREYISVRNLMNRTSYFKLNLMELSPYITLNETEFYIKAGQDKTFFIDINIPKEMTPGTIIGSIVITDGKTEKKIYASIDVVSTKASFDVNITIPNDYLVVQPGNTLMSEISISLIEEGSAEMLLEYTIVDDQGKIYLNVSEIVSVVNQADIIKKFRLDKNLEDGTYLLQVRTTRGNEQTSTSAWFDVREENREKFKFEYYLLLPFLLIFVLIYIIYKVHKMNEAFAPEKKKKD